MRKAELVEILKQVSDLVSKVALASEETEGPTSPAPGYETPTPDAFKPREKGEVFAAAEPLVHKVGPHTICETDKRGFATPDNKSPTELVLDASEGFVPLWAKGVTLRWRFNEQSMGFFQNVSAAKAGIRSLFANAVTMWGNSAPIGFKEQSDAWDFEIVMRGSDNCSGGGCVLASSFFPDAGRHELFIYPKMFTQSHEEQIETLVHEIGHVFGLRHFFAQLSETQWRSEVFGTHSPFSIMNYGTLSKLTATDKSDLKKLYNLVWSGHLSEVNGTPIRLFKPFHDSGADVGPGAMGGFTDRRC